MKRIFTFALVMLFAFSLSAQKKVKSNLDKTPISNGTVINTEKAQWDILFTFGGLVAGAPGIETDGTNFYTTLWNGSDFHRYDMDGANGVTFTVAGVANVRDMAYDGQYFYGAAADMNLYQMDLANETLVSTISATCTGVTGIRHISYDPTLDGGNGGFWIGNWTELGAIAMDGSELVAGGSITLESCYGSAYDNWSDPANPKLWLFQQPTGAEAIFYEFDINTMAMTGVTHDAADAPGFEAGSLSGGACTYEADGKFILVGNIQQDPNLIVGYELAITADLAAPNVATDFTAVADEMGAFTVDLDWTNPILDVEGNALAELDMMEIRIDGVTTYTMTYTNTTAGIGAMETYTATVAEGGMHTFTIIGSNSNGYGIPVSMNVFVGIDVEVSEVTLPEYLVLDETFSPTVTVTNNGVGTQSFDVVLVGEGYTEMLSVVDLASGDSEMITFPEWSSAIAGTYSFTATSSLMDIDADNDMMTSYINVFGGCPHTLVLTDDYGDGWNGNTASVTVNGMVQLDHVTVDVDENTYTFFAEDGDDIQFDFWGEGTWISEVAWVMTDGLGGVLLEVSAGDISGAVTENVVGLCTLPPTYTVTFTVYGEDTMLPIEGASVEVMPLAKEVMTTDVNGVATFELENGDYYYSISMTDYDTYTGTFTVFDAVVDMPQVDLVPATIGINELNANVNVYPNPSNGAFTVSVNGTFTLQVVDITGKVISTQEITNTEDINIQEAGVYMLRLTNDVETLNYKVIVK